MSYEAHFLTDPKCLAGSALASSVGYPLHVSLESILGEQRLCFSSLLLLSAAKVRLNVHIMIACYLLVVSLSVFQQQQAPSLHLN